MLLDRDGQDGTRPLLKICDFGYSKHEMNSSAKTGVGTPIYMAPEIIHGGNRYDAKVRARNACLRHSLARPGARTHAAQSPGARLLGVKAMQPPSCASAPRPYLAASPCRLTLSPLQAADLWSVGVILFAMLIGRYPFSQRESNVARNIVSATYSLPDDVQARRLPATCFGRSNASPCMRARACVPAQLQSRARRRCPAGLRH